MTSLIVLPATDGEDGGRACVTSMLSHLRHIQADNTACCLLPVRNKTFLKNEIKIKHTIPVEKCSIWDEKTRFSVKMTQIKNPDLFAMIYLHIVSIIGETWFTFAFNIVKHSILSGSLRHYDNNSTVPYLPFLSVVVFEWVNSSIWRGQTVVFSPRQKIFCLGSVNF